MRVLVCGSRSLDGRHRDAVEARLAELRPSCVIEGGAPGADTLARAWCEAQMGGADYSPALMHCPAAWTKHRGCRCPQRAVALGLGCPAAGPQRNQRMLDEGRPDLVLAFHTDPGLGRGTADMVRRARKAGVPVEVVILPGGRP